MTRKAELSTLAWVIEEGPFDGPFRIIIDRKGRKYKATIATEYMERSGWGPVVSGEANASDLALMRAIAKLEDAAVEAMPEED